MLWLVTPALTKGECVEFHLRYILAIMTGYLPPDTDMEGVHRLAEFLPEGCVQAKKACLLAQFPWLRECTVFTAEELDIVAKCRDRDAGAMQTVLASWLERQVNRYGATHMVQR